MTRPHSPAGPQGSAPRAPIRGHVRPEPLAPALLGPLAARALEDGGFPARPGGGFHPAATAWALLALPHGHPAAGPARARLATAALPGGGLPLHPSQPQTLWPTAPALMALAGPAQSPAESAAAKALADFLLSSSGAHWPRDPASPMDHDTSLRGWAWTAEAHSWVEPTALAVLALDAAGLCGHPRLAEGRAMLLDRQLPSGGWNQGNVHVYGVETRPHLLDTAAALCALAGSRPEASVARSLDYLRAGAEGLHAPLSLAWSLLALGAWATGGDGGWLEAGRRRLAASLQGDYGPGAVLGEPETSCLALAAIALTSPDGLAAHLSRRRAQGPRP